MQNVSVAVQVYVSPKLCVNGLSCVRVCIHERERRREGRREIDWLCRVLGDIFFSSIHFVVPFYLCIHWLFLVRALTGN